MSMQREDSGDRVPDQDSTPLWDNAVTPVLRGDAESTRAPQLIEELEA